MKPSPTTLHLLNAVHFLQENVLQEPVKMLEFKRLITKAALSGSKVVRLHTKQL